MIIQNLVSHTLLYFREWDAIKLPRPSEGVCESGSHLTSHPLFDSGGADVSKTLPVLYIAIEGKLKNVEACAGSRFPKGGDGMGPLIES